MRRRIVEACKKYVCQMTFKMEASNICQKLRNFGTFESLPSRESHVRELLKLETDDQRADGWKWELAQAKKAILEPIGKANIAANKGGTTTLSKVDKQAHNTQQEIAKDLGWSTRV